MDVTTLQAEIVTTQAILTQIAAAILALSDITVTSYSLDTGQTVQRVSRENLVDLIKQRALLQNELCMLQARLSGGNVQQALPAF